MICGMFTHTPCVPYVQCSPHLAPASLRQIQWQTVCLHTGTRSGQMQQAPNRLGYGWALALVQTLVLQLVHHFQPVSFSLSRPTRATHTAEVAEGRASIRIASHCEVV